MAAKQSRYTLPCFPAELIAAQRSLNFRDLICLASRCRDLTALACRRAQVIATADLVRLSTVCPLLEELDLDSLLWSQGSACLLHFACPSPSHPCPMPHLLLLFRRRSAGHSTPPYAEPFPCFPRLRVFVAPCTEAVGLISSLRHPPQPAPPRPYSSYGYASWRRPTGRFRAIC